VPGNPKSQQGWDILSKKLDGLATKSVEEIENIKAMVVLVVNDALCEVVRNVTSSTIKKESLFLILRYALFHLRMTANKKSTHDSRLFEEIAKRGSLLLGFIAQFE
jgi:pantothenate kinase type III